LDGAAEVMTPARRVRRSRFMKYIPLDCAGHLTTSKAIAFKTVVLAIKRILPAPERILPEAGRVTRAS
jgi:hypothetical protein